MRQLCIQILESQNTNFNKEQFIEKLADILPKDNIVVQTGTIEIHVPNEHQESVICAIKELPEVVLAKDIKEQPKAPLPFVLIEPIPYENYENKIKNKTYKSNLAKTENLLKRFQKTNTKKYSTALYNRTRHK